MNSRGHPSSLLPYPFLIRNSFPLNAVLTGPVFQSSVDGETRALFNDLPATFCIITESLKSLDYGASLVVYLWGFYDIKFILSQCKSKPGLIPQYT